jgi:hypothetical protein
VERAGRALVEPPDALGSHPRRSGRVILDFPVSYGFRTQTAFCAALTHLWKLEQAVWWSVLLPGANMTNWRACGFSVPGHRDGTGTNPAIAPAMVAASILGRRQKWLLCRSPSDGCGFYPGTAPKVAPLPPSGYCVPSFAVLPANMTKAFDEMRECARRILSILAKRANIGANLSSYQISRSMVTPDHVVCVLIMREC